MRRSIPGLLAVLLLACGNESAVVDPQAAELKQGQARLDQVPDAGFCDRLASAEWIVEPGCTGCTVADAAAAADGNDQTHASVTFTAVGPRTGGAAIRAHAPPGVVYEAGRVASAFLREPNEMIDYDLYVRTYLGGVLQEQDGYHGDIGSRSDNEAISSFRTTKPFDAIEYYIKVATSRTEAVGEIVELCLDAN